MICSHSNPSIIYNHEEKLAPHGLGFDEAPQMIKLVSEKSGMDYKRA